MDGMCGEDITSLSRAAKDGKIDGELFSRKTGCSHEGVSWRE